MTSTHYFVPGELARARAAIVVEFSPNADLLNASRVCPTLVRGIFLFCVLNALIPFSHDNFRPVDDFLESCVMVFYSFSLCLLLNSFRRFFESSM